MRKFIPLLMLWQLYLATVIWHAQPAMKAWLADAMSDEPEKSAPAVMVSGTVTATTPSLPSCTETEVARAFANGWPGSKNHVWCAQPRCCQLPSSDDLPPCEGENPGVPVVEGMRSCR